MFAFNCLIGEDCHMASYQVVHTVNSPSTNKENVKLAAARALYAELLKYYNTKATSAKSA